MKITGYSRDANLAIAVFLSHIRKDPEIAKTLLAHKIDLCKYQLLVITRDELDLKMFYKNRVDFLKIQEVHKIWQRLADRDLKDDVREGLWNQIRLIGKDVPTPFCPTLKRFHEAQEGNEFFLLLPGTEDSGLPMYEMSFLVNFYQVEHGNLPLHASGVVHKGGIYVFCGPSGAGKSTAAALSETRGAEILDEDQLLIHHRGNVKFSADAWAYSNKICNLPIRGIFRLVQDNEDRIVSLDRMATARMVTEASLQVFLTSITGDLSRELFRLSAEMGRVIPGYDLHFRNSPDFWKLIDTEIILD